MKKVIAFDLDDTLTETKSLITDEMSALLGDLLEHYHVCVISGGSIEQYKSQFLSNLPLAGKKLELLHLMPTCGTQYYRINKTKNDWQRVYAENFKDSEKKIIRQALEEGIDETGLRVKNPQGALIEDRGSQMTYSALGQAAEPAKKKAWDPDGAKKRKIHAIVANKIPQFEVRIGGSTSIDVTKKGIDKAYGMKKLMELLDVKKEEILFVGDRVWEGGNDYPVKLMGIDCIAIDSYEQTPWVVRGILANR